MAANQYGIDLAEIYRNKEAVEGAKTQNKLAALKLGEAERIEAERPAKEAAAQEKNNVLAGIRSKAVTGDVDAQQQLLALDPKEGPSFIEAVSKMNDTQRESTKRTVEKIGQLSGYVLQGGTQEEQARRYQIVYQGLSPEMQAKMPQQYDPSFIELSLSKAMTMDKILENPKAIQVGGEDVVYQGGREIERQARPTKSEGGSSGIASADENTMYKQSVELLGGLFDQAGNITNLDPTVRNKIQGITTEATKIFRQGGVTRSEAVSQAARSFGVDVESIQPKQTQQSQMVDDPLGIR